MIKSPENLTKEEQDYLNAVEEYLFSKYCNIEPYLELFDESDIKFAVANKFSVESFVYTILF